MFITSKLGNKFITYHPVTKIRPKKSQERVANRPPGTCGPTGRRGPGCPGEVGGARRENGSCGPGAAGGGANGPAVPQQPHGVASGKTLRRPSDRAGLRRGRRDSAGHGVRAFGHGTGAAQPPAAPQGAPATSTEPLQEVRRNPGSSSAKHASGCKPPDPRPREAQESSHSAAPSGTAHEGPTRRAPCTPTAPSTPQAAAQPRGRAREGDQRPLWDHLSEVSLKS